MVATEEGNLLDLFRAFERRSEDLVVRQLYSSSLPITYTSGEPYAAPSAAADAPPAAAAAAATAATAAGGKEEEAKEGAKKTTTKVFENQGPRVVAASVKVKPNKRYVGRRWAPFFLPTLRPR